MKEQIFMELREKGFKKGTVWKINQINAFRSRFNDKEQDDFRECLQKLVDENFFIIEQGCIYRLTPKGYEELYK